MILIYITVAIILIIALIIVIRKHNLKQNNNKRITKKYYPSTQRKYIPLYDKLFFSLIGKYNENKDSTDLRKMLSLYDKYDLYVIPITYNFESFNEVVLTSGLKNIFEEQNIGLIIPETNIYVDEIDDNQSNLFNSIANTNFSFRSIDQELNATALSGILDIKIDGINKLIFWKRDEREISIIPLNHFKDTSKDFPKIDLFVSKFSKLKIKENINSLIADYLSLHWKQSIAEENSTLRISASKIRSNLYNRFLDKEDFEMVNLFKIIENLKPSPQIFYKLTDVSQKDIELKERILKEPIDKIKKDFNYSLEELEQIRDYEIENIIQSIIKNEDLDYKARIFLKTSNLISKVLEEEDLDYSSITIGYAKFFEREINLSVVQLIRKQLGIEMPLFYEKYYPTDKDYIIKMKEDFSIDFNKKEYSGTNYLPPGLGQSLISFKSMANDLNEHFSNSKLLIKNGRTLNAIRNNSAHPKKIVTKKEVTKMKEILVKLYVNKIFDEIIETKKKLRA